MFKPSGINYFSRFEIFLWISSVILIIGSFLGFQTGDYLTLIASLIGATSLLLNAKGNVIGQILTVVFSIFYGIISYSCAYYGEMVTYLGMTAPIAMAAVITWIKNPAQKGRLEVKVNHLSRKEYYFLGILSILVTIVFYYILSYFHTAQICLSTLSVLTSFLASYLTMRRCENYALAYASNDIILIILWILATGQDRRYFSVIICFVVFLINDIYGYYSWGRMKKKQESSTTE